MRYNLVIFENIADAETIKRILGDSVVLIGNCISCFEGIYSVFADRIKDYEDYEVQ